MNTRLFVLLSFVLFAVSCNNDNEPDVILVDGLNFIIQNQFVSEPAKVSVFFKVETKDGDPVAGMTDQDFTIFENNNRISVDEAARQISPRAQLFAYSTLLILDLSASVTNTNLPRLKEASKQFINAIMPDNNDGAVEIGISWFDGEDKLHELLDFTSDKTQLVAAIEAITPDISSDNSTDLYGAVQKGVDRIEDQFRTYQNDDLAYAASVVIFTDGTDQAARYTFDNALDAVNSAEDRITFYSIGLGNEIDASVLEAVGKNGFEFAENTNQLIETFDKIARKVSDDANSYYLFEYCSPKRNGQHDVKIEGVWQNLKGSLTQGFNATGFRGGCTL